MKTWTLKLNEDELKALARAIATHMELLASQPDSSDKVTTFVNLCRIIAKTPEADWFSEEVRA